MSLHPGQLVPQSPWTIRCHRVRQSRVHDVVRFARRRVKRAVSDSRPRVVCARRYATRTSRETFHATMCESTGAAVAKACLISAQVHCRTINSSWLCQRSRDLQSAPSRHASLRRDNLLSTRVVYIVPSHEEHQLIRVATIRSGGATVEVADSCVYSRHCVAPYLELGMHAYPPLLRTAPRQRSNAGHISCRCSNSRAMDALHKCERAIRRCVWRHLRHGRVRSRVSRT